MNSPRNFYTLAAAVSGALVVGIGAFGAHGLDLPTDLEAIYHTGVEYHAYHTLALLAVCAIAPMWSGRAVVWVGRCWLAGVLLFSGSLYLLAVTDTRWLGAITPLGGLAFIAGWVALAFAATKTPLRD